MFLNANCVAVGLAALVMQTGCANDEAAPLPQKAQITSSKETTYLTEPLTEDGRVDYLRALNERAGKGVTVENNAVVPLMRAFGPDVVDESVRKEFFNMLGVAVPPADGNYIESIDTFANRVAESKRDFKTVDAILDARELATEGPWRSDQFPHIKEWLEINKEPLEHIAAAVNRSHYYFVYLAPGNDNDGELLQDVLLPIARPTRAAAQLLAVRAMLRLGEGRILESQTDALACHRLGRLVGQGASLTEALLAVGIDAVAWHCDVSISQHAEFTSKQAEGFRRQLRQLPPLPDMAEKIDWNERLTYLNNVVYASKNGPERLIESVRGKPGGANDGATNPNANAAVDWNAALRFGNNWYDRYADAFSKATHSERVRALEQCQEELKSLSKQAVAPKGLANTFGAKIVADESVRESNRENVKYLLIATLMFPLKQLALSEDRARTRERLIDLTLAIAAFHADRDAFSDRLSDLMPDYVDKLPLDIFSDKPLVYMQQDNGYLLYSVGPNLKDDGGADFRASPTGDDLVVRVHK